MFNVSISLMYGHFNAQEEHKGWMVAQSANSGVLPTKEKKYTTKRKHTTKQKRTTKQELA